MDRVVSHESMILLPYSTSPRAHLALVLTIASQLRRKSATSAWAAVTDVVKWAHVHRRSKARKSVFLLALTGAVALLSRRLLQKWCEHDPGRSLSLPATVGEVSRETRCAIPGNGVASTLVTASGESTAGVPATGDVSKLGTAIAQAARLQVWEDMRRRPSLVSANKSSLNLSDEARVARYPLHENRMRLLNGEVRNLETLQPFARLQLRVVDACGVPLSHRFASDLRLHIFSNDALVCRSPRVSFSASPVWNYDCVVDVYSPFTMIRVAVVEAPLLEKEHLIGFVEIDLAEIEPNGSHVVGFFGLRAAQKLVGNASDRFARHKEACDDVAEWKAERTKSWLDRFRGAASKYEPVHPCELRMEFCLGTTSACQPYVRHRHPSWLKLITGAAIGPPLFSHLWLSDEWFACCFPRPVLENHAADDGWLHLHELKRFHDEFNEVSDVIMNQLARKFSSAWRYVMHWRCWYLSLLVLAHWWTCCVWPFLLIPCIPLWLCLWMYLLRDPAWRRYLLMHEATAPLNQDGLDMVASFNNSLRMGTWLLRVIQDRGGKVVSIREFEEFTKLIFQDGRPAVGFGALIEELGGRPWISWSEARQKRCGFGHVLECLGSGSYTESHLWVCNGSYSSRRRRSMCAASQERGLHLGVVRYRCPSCRVDLCKPCVEKDKQHYFLSGVKVPDLGFEGIKDFILGKEEFVQRLKQTLTMVLQKADGFLNPDEVLLARRTYMFLFAASFALFCLTYSLLCSALFKVCGFLIGTAFIAQKAEPVCRVRTVCKANWDFLTLQKLRAGGGCGSWAFFRPDGVSTVSADVRAD